MKLVRYGDAGKEKPGILDAQGAIRDLSGVVSDIDGAALSAEGLAKIRAAELDSLPKVSGSPRLGSPVANVGKLVAIGLNYSDHAKEANQADSERADHLHEGHHARSAGRTTR